MCTLQCEQKSKKISTNFLTQSIKNYVLGLLICRSKKNFTNITSMVKTSYYFLNIGFDELFARRKEAQNFLINLVKMHATEENPGILVIDATQIKKLYGKKLKVLCYDHSGSMKAVLKGISCVVAAWTNGKIVIPLIFDFWVRKKDIKDDRIYRKKTKISRELILELKDKIPFLYIALDGDYGNEKFLTFLYKHNLKYSVRMPSNRKVVIDGIEETPKKHLALKLIRNKRYKKVEGFYKGIPITIVTHKRKGKKRTKQVVFIVSNIQNLSAREHVKAYACRWPIEKMFRTMKQSLGLEDCQSVSTKKQRGHILAIFLAFAELETIKISKKKSSPEEVLKIIRFQNPFKTNPLTLLQKGFIM